MQRQIHISMNQPDTNHQAASNQLVACKVHFEFPRFKTTGNQAFENAEYYMSSSVSYLPKSGESDLPFDAAKVEIIFDLGKNLRNYF